MRASRSAGQLIVGGSLVSGDRPGSGGSGGARNDGIFRRQERAKTGLEHCSIKQYEFGHALGEHGLEWEGTIVSSVKGQAKNHGIMPGWKIYMVDGHITKSTDDIWLRMQEAKWQWRPCTVGFITDVRAIRADKVCLKQHQIKEEELRLARLPFEGTMDPVHLDQVKGEFKLQGYIDDVENRSITVKQLERVVRWVDKHCHRWRDMTTRLKLTLPTINLYHLTDWLVKPATYEKDCSFVEVMTKERQPPNWVVIHWWGEKVVDFMRCLEIHITTRDLAKDTACFWISAFANRQHGHEADIQQAISATSYFRALSAAKFQALMTLEPKTEHVKDGVTHIQGPATMFSRIWCNIEAMMCCYELPVGVDPVVDIAATQGTKAMLLTSGLTEEEETMETTTPGSGFKAKMEREKNFNLDIIEAGLKVTVLNSNASEIKEKNRILNCIAERDLDLPPLPKHELYEKANCRLRALIATTCWRRVMAGNSSFSLQAKVAEALKNDVWDDTLELSMAWCPGVAERLPFVMRSLHSGLQHLTLDFKGCSLEDPVLKDLAGQLPSKLEELHIDFSENPDAGNVGVANFLANVPPKLKGLEMSLKGTKASKEFKESADSLEGIKNAIFEEAQRGSLCTTVNLCPSNDRRMIFSSKKSQV